MSNEVTLGEIARKLDNHIQDSKQNNTKQNDILTVLLTQSTESKSQIGNIMEKIGEHREILESHSKNIGSLQGSRKYSTGALWVIGIVMTASIGISPYLLGLYIKQSVRDVLAQYDITIIK